LYDPSKPAAIGKGRPRPAGAIPAGMAVSDTRTFSITSSVPIHGV